MKKLLFILFMVLVAASCKNASSDKQQTQASGEEFRVTAPEKGKGKYGIKSGIVEYKTSVMGFEAIQTLYFDNYGALEATVTSMEIMGMKTQNVTITKEGYIYTLDLENKTGTKTAIYSGSVINFEDITDQVTKDWNLKKVGKESVLGKECDKWSMNNESMGMKGHYWVWKGVALKVDADMSSSKMLMEATKFEDNVNVPAEKFEIPADIVIN